MSTLGQARNVGVVVVLGALLVIAMFTFFSGGLFRHTYTLDVLFNDATGATKDADVVLAGVQIGSVRQIKLTPSQKADLTLEIQEKSRIPLGSTFSIITPILGSTGQVVVTPPPNSAKRPDAVIQAGAANLTGESTPNLNTAFSKANVLLAQLSETTRRSDRLIDALTDTTLDAKRAIGGPQVRQTLGNLNQASANGVALTKQLNTALAQDNALLVGLLRQTGAGSKAALGNIDVTTAQFKRLAVDNRTKLNQIASDLRDTTDSLSGITTQANEDFQSGHVTKNLAGIVGNLKAASDNLVVISGNFQKLSSDQGIQTDLRETLHSVRASAEQTDALLERLGQIAGVKRRPAVVAVVPGVGTVAVTPAHTARTLIAPLLRYDLVQDLRAGHFRTDLDAFLPAPGNTGLFARAGIYGLGDNNRGIFQVGQAFGPDGLLDARVGVYASQLSVGGDIGLGRRASLSLDAWDAQRLHLDARGRLTLGDGFGLLVGAEDITRRTSPTIGLEFRR